MTNKTKNEGRENEKNVLERQVQRIEVRRITKVSAEQLPMDPHGIRSRRIEALEQARVNGSLGRGTSPQAYEVFLMLACAEEFFNAVEYNGDVDKSIYKHGLDQLDYIESAIKEGRYSKNFLPLISYFREKYCEENRQLGSQLGGKE